jgi:Putative DNA-binding domain
LSDVHQTRLHDLLAQQSEYAALEYIGDCDLNERRDIVELATEVSAMAFVGGDIVIGCDDYGKPTGSLDERKSGLFDDATLRDKLSRYLPASVSIRAGRHQVDGHYLVLLHVDRHEDGAVAFIADGTHESRSGQPVTAFRRGDIFVRHGSKIERPNQEDIHQISVEAIRTEQSWRDQIQRIQNAVHAIGAIAKDEEPNAPDGRIQGIGIPTRVPTARRLLAGELAGLKSLGGPDLPACEELAGASIFIFYNQFLGAVYSATDEIARALEARAARG